LRQQRIIDVDNASLECTIYGSGDPIVLLANAGCDTGYFAKLARRLGGAGLQSIAINMRGVGESCGPLEGVTLHDLAADVAGVIESLGCAPAHILGHAFGNRIARCLAADRPSLVRSATQEKMNGSDCVTLLGARWLSPASNPGILSEVECWPAVHIAHLATSRNVPPEEWWSAGIAPLLVVQGLDDEVAPPGNGHALREQIGPRVRLIDLPRAGHFLVLEQPEAVAQAVAGFVGARSDDVEGAVTRTTGTLS
jgi:pimeloyl-ACP methyl ester carboxylesterase